MESVGKIKRQLKQAGVTLVAVSKTKPIESIMEVYATGVRDFGENRVQEMVDKYEKLPKDIRWHQIGHLQKNKVKYLAPFVHLIHSVDSLSLLKVIQKEADKNNRNIEILLQLKIAVEETKYGLSVEECTELLQRYFANEFPNVTLKGFMGMASFVADEGQIRSEFQKLTSFQKLQIEEYPEYVSNLQVLSMGMSGDYKIAVDEGSTMVRIGSAIFGVRNYQK